jgi:hypothetical protein
MKADGALPSQNSHVLQPSPNFGQPRVENLYAFTMPPSLSSSSEVGSSSPLDVGPSHEFATRRFDAPHSPAAESVAPSEPIRIAENSESGVASDPLSEPTFCLDSRAIREAHSDDLIEFLQRWSEDLDQRAARLHADIATHERRERAFRLWMQNRRAELDEQLARNEEIQRNAEACARRIALTGVSSG